MGNVREKFHAGYLTLIVFLRPSPPQRPIIGILFDPGDLKLDQGYKAFAFDVAQDVDSTLYIILATQTPGSGSDLLVLKPFKPVEYDMAKNTTDMSHLKMKKNGKPTMPIVKSIHMVCVTRTSEHCSREFRIVRNKSDGL
ncbi:uncharacterized protein LAJ45_03027 [Morchella importuna]|uniref:uncharacterized protein n=1 Tax=Morchella importuna TaxID=1174673 RepID=UPI001E8DEEBE|nr:uncharacterized protein LAJ45_03027 [Morchella importuna]KAH8152802.1 hypothetical protein LAJ45_03027 [Morchella importuna]